VSSAPGVDEQPTPPENPGVPTPPDVPPPAEEPVAPDAGAPQPERGTRVRLNLGPLDGQEVRCPPPWPRASLTLAVEVEGEERQAIYHVRRDHPGQGTGVAVADFYDYLSALPGAVE
jgi:hypothetical protein